MQWPSKSTHINTVLIIIFFAMWLYTEIDENRARAEWQTFTRAGARFTAEDGERLEARIEKLEECPHYDISE